MFTRAEPKQDRSRATRERLLDAAVDSLAEVGWHGTTVVAVAARAGVSRGAAQHHFATRGELVGAAMERVGEGVIEGLRADTADVPADQRVLRTLEVITDLWDDRIGRAAMQLWIAASTDPTLRELVLPLERRLSADLEALLLDQLAVDRASPEVAQTLRLTLDVTRGIGLGTLVRRDLATRRAYLAQWAAVLSSMPGVSLL